MLRRCKGEGSEVRGGEQLTSFSLTGLGITDLFYAFLGGPNSVLTGKLLSAFLKAPKVHNFLYKEPGLEKQKQTGSEGRGKWEVTEVRA